MDRIKRILFMFLILCPFFAPAQDIKLFKKDNGRAFQVSSHSANEGDAWSIAPGETKVLMDKDGTGIIYDIWFTFGGTTPEHGKEILRYLTLKMYWDNSKYPSVESPVGDFFGAGHGQYSQLISENIQITSRGYISYFPMPFRKNARIEITNTSEMPINVFFHFTGAEYKKLPKDAMYFHARWNRDNPTVEGKNYTILEAEGDGYYAGTIMYMQGYTKGDKFNFLEGDEWIYIDGEEDASIKGTGGEDYFQGAWYFIDGKFNAPNHGLIKMNHETKEVSAYRFHTRDRINFTKSIKVQIEHGQRTYNDAKADFSSIVYWYQKEIHKDMGRISDDREPITVAEAFLLPDAVEMEGTPGESMPYYMSTYREGDERWSNDMASLWVLDKAGLIVEKEFEVAEDGTYKIGVNNVVNDHNGIYSVEIDGTQIGGDIDAYCEEPMDAYLLCRNKAAGLQQLGVMDLKAGTHKIKFTITGKNEKSKGYNILMDCFTVQKK